jgi:hypothetical protein
LNPDGKRVPTKEQNQVERDVAQRAAAIKGVSAIISLKPFMPSRTSH